MFVLEALVLTFMTTPLVTWLYPPHLRRRISATGANFDSVADEEGISRQKNSPTRSGDFKNRFTVVLDKLEHLPAMMALTQLIQPLSPQPPDRREPAVDRRASTSSQIGTNWNPISTEALRLIELSDRVSAVMKSSAAESLLLTDPLLSIFRMFGQLNGMNVDPTLSIVPFDDLAYNVVEHARNYESDMILIPWLPPVHDAFDGPAPEYPASPKNKSPVHQPVALPGNANNQSSSKNPHSNNPFLLFKPSNMRVGGSEGMPSAELNTVSVIHSQFVRGVFSQATTDVALFVDRGTLDGTGIRGARTRQHVFLPFFGGPDDRLALEFVIQICANSGIRGTVVRITKTDLSIAMMDEVSRPDEIHLGEGEGKVDQKDIEPNLLTINSVWVRYINIILAMLTMCRELRGFLILSTAPTTQKLACSRTRRITSSGRDTLLHRSRLLHRIRRRSLRAPLHPRQFHQLISRR